MEMHVEGWDRVTVYGNRQMFEIDLTHSQDVTDKTEFSYPYTGSIISFSGGDAHVWFRLHVEPTMGGSYKARLRFNAIDIAKLLTSAFQNYKLDELLHLLEAAKKE